MALQTTAFSKRQAGQVTASHIAMDGAYAYPTPGRVPTDSITEAEQPGAAPAHGGSMELGSDSRPGTGTDRIFHRIPCAHRPHLLNEPIIDQPALKAALKRSARPLCLPRMSQFVRQTFPPLPPVTRRRQGHLLLLHLPPARGRPGLRTLCRPNHVYRRTASRGLTHHRVSRREGEGPRAAYEPGPNILF